MSLKNLFSNKINIEHDIQCILECKLDDDLNSSFILKNITGSKKIELLGSDVCEMDLNLLFSDNFRQIHNNFMLDILKNRDKSKFWDLFVNGKMNRIVNIINPITKFEYGVKLNIIFNSQEKNKVLFNVFFTDVSIINKIINNTGLLTHDLRSIIKSAQNIVSVIQSSYNSSSNSGSNSDTIFVSSSNSNNNEENFSTLNELLDEAYQMCSKSRTKIIIEHINKRESKLFTHIKIYLEISKYIKKIKKIFPNVKFNMNIKTNICISSSQNDTLWHLILNIIKNAINANSNIISICIDDNINNELLITVKDNGKGMSESTKLNFFSRKLPEKIKDNEKIDSNRGEGFLLSYYEWVNLGGMVNVLNSEINIGTEFLIKIKGLYENEKFILTKTQIDLINDILNKQNKKKVLLVDDSLLNLKIMSLKIIRQINKNYKHSNFPTLTPDEWQNIGIIQIETDEFVFLLLSNGMYGREISVIIEPELIITDIQMPALNGVEMIKDLLEYNLKTKIIINSAYLDKDNEEINELIHKYNIEFIEKGISYDFIKNLFGTH